jgi:hypothetical protein
MAERDFSKPIVYRVDGMRDVRARRNIVYKRDAGAELMCSSCTAVRFPWR